MEKRAYGVFVLVSALLLSSSSMFTQAKQGLPGGSTAPKAASDQDIQMLREDVRSQRKQITAANMTLTADEATKFWPIYDQYIQETIKVNDDRWAMIKEYAANYNAMTDQHAQEYMKRSVAIDHQLTALRAKYVSMFQKVVSTKQTAQWYQIDRRLDLLINLQLAALIPVVDPNK